MIVAEWPQRHKVVGGQFGDRDYVRGAVARVNKSNRVHLSRVFTSKNDGLDKLAVSVGFRLKDGRVWVLGATIPTDASTSGGGLSQERASGTSSVAFRAVSPCSITRCREVGVIL